MNWRALSCVNLALLTAGCGAGAQGGKGLPPLPEAFDESRCAYRGSEYQGHPEEGEARYRYVLRPEFETPESVYHRLIFELRDRSSDRLLTSLRLNWTVSNGVPTQHALSDDGPEPMIDTPIMHLDRNFSDASWSEPGVNFWAAAYIMVFPVLTRELHYGRINYDAWGRSLVFHTPEKVTPRFPQIWVLSRCGAPPPA